MKTPIETEPKVKPITGKKKKIPSVWLVYSGCEVENPPRLITLEFGSTPIGREVRSGIVLPNDPRASRHHATLHVDATGRLTIVDENSRNGTSVNDLRIQDAELVDGDWLAIGDSHFIVREMPETVEDAEIPSLLGVSPAICRVRALLQRVGPTSATVLLLGESGTGKEVAAKALHALSGRSGEFVSLNSTTITEALAESTLFGHTKNSFTNATEQPGLIRSAHEGTFFLDEVGDLALTIQPKFLRVLQDHEVLPLGATKPIRCDVRVIAATNRDLKQSLAESTFRGDLYARLAEIPIELPPLRQRKEDILLLLLDAMGPPKPRLSPALVEKLLKYDYPYNVRNVQAMAKQLRIHGAKVAMFDVTHLESFFRASAPPALVDRTSTEPPESTALVKNDAREPPPNKARLIELMGQFEGVIADVARYMGRSRKQVYRWIQKAGIDPDPFRK
ncbi:MAG TPA: sigma 54-interacting transcriptional regulator [Polyangium sp.]|nr:sigma 54-interacting transcriptional regulator [Polyangium sp.]